MPSSSFLGSLTHFLWVFLLASSFWLKISDVSAAPLNYAVIANLSRNTFSSSLLQSSIEAYTSNVSSSLTLFENAVPYFINSNGSLLTALSQLDIAAKNASGGLDIIFIGDTSSVTEGVADYVSSSLVSANGTSLSQIPIISLLPASESLCKNYPQVVCICPTESSIAQGLLEVSYFSLSWEGASAVLMDTFGDHRLGAVLAEKNARHVSPTITEYYYVSEPLNSFPALSDASEVGVLSFLPDQDMLLLYSHYINASTTNKSITKNSGNSTITSADNTNLTNSSRNTTITSNFTCPYFFIGNYLSLNARELFVNQGLCAVLFVPHYATPSQLQEQGILSTNSSKELVRSDSSTRDGSTRSSAILDETGAFIISYLVDAMQIVEHAGGTSNISALRSVNFTGVTGQVLFSFQSYQRLGISIDLISTSYSVDSPLISYTLSMEGTSQIQNLKPAVVSSLIPPSPLSTATLCLAIPPTCEDVSQATSIYYYLLYLFDVIPTTAFKLNVKLINTGNEGVSGYSTFLSVARLCTAVLGTGHASIDYRIAPLINYYDILQIDYQTATTVFTSSTLSTIPSLSRTIPLYSYSDIGFAEICTHFGWERVIVIATSDQYGVARGKDATAAMISRNVYVEKVYYLTNTSLNSMLQVFNEIYKSDVSRIIFFAVSLFGEEAENFFSVRQQAQYLNNYVFLLDQTLCTYGNTNPSARNKLQSSICMAPEAKALDLDDLNTFIKAKSLSSKAKSMLISGGFPTQATTCSYDTVSAYNGFAIDAGAVFYETVSEADATSISWANSSALLPLVRNESYFGVTTDFTIDSEGYRDWASYECNIQTPNQTIVTFGSWSENQKPNFQSSSAAKWIWMDNTTVVPLDTFRDASFVFQSTALSSPGGIAISILGFVITIFAFFLCFRHYDMQHKVERTLSSNNIPITETELKKLRSF